MPGSSSEAIGELSHRDAFAPPTQESPLQRAQAGRSIGGAAARKARELEHPLDVLAAAVEPSSDLVGDHTGSCQAPDATFEWPKPACVVVQDPECYRVAKTA